MGSLTFTPPRALDGTEDLSGFSCGVELIGSWVEHHALRAWSMGTAVVYATFCEGCLAGFYTLSSQPVQREGLHGWIARNAAMQIPVILLGKFGVDRRFQGLGLGHDLFLDAVRRSKHIADQLGARAIVVDPFDDSARTFCQHAGFRDIPGSQKMLAKLG